MRTIGRIVRLQIQRGSLKTGEKPIRRYDPTPLLAVPRLNVTPDGALGSPDGGDWIVDVHHRAHPFTKNEDGLHGISLGFTAHYDAMRDRQFTYDELAGGVVICAPDGTERVRLRVLEVAHPCKPFTGWALGKTVEPADLKKHLQFLDDGMRGFYCVGEGTGTVALGDLIAIL